MILLQIAKRYDILLIQEIRDIDEITIPTFVDAINEDIGFVSFLVVTHNVIAVSQTFIATSSSSI